MKIKKIYHLLGTIIICCDHSSRIRSFSEDLRLGVLVADGAMHDAVRTEERS